MATVRITKELTEAIQRNARAKFADRIKAAEDAAPKGTKWGDYIYDKLFGQYAPIMDQLPAEFFHARDSITVSRIGGQSVNLKLNCLQRGGGLLVFLLVCLLSPTGMVWSH